MSGLFGFFDPASELPQGTAARMAHVMGGPADRSTVILQGSKFAIGCVTKGIYPGEGDVLTNQDSRRSCLFTGRLLGFSGQQLTSDPITNARRTFLDDATEAGLGAVNGSFAAAVWDEGRQALELITDRYGMYPIYVARHRSATLFAGQIKALLASGVVPVEFDPAAVVLMLSIGELVDDLTLIRAVRVLPAGTMVTFLRGGEKRRRYWEYGFHEDETEFDSAARQLGGLLRQAVARVFSDSISVGVPLSGGLDSRVLLAAAPDPSQVPSFTWGVAGCRDLNYGAVVARALGSPNQSFVYDGGYLERFATLGVWITEGQLPCVDFHVMPYVERIAERCDTILNGYAGGGVLGGAFTKRDWWRASTREQAGIALWRRRDNGVPPAYRAGLLGPVLGDCGYAKARTSFLNCYMQASGHSPMDAALAFLLDSHSRRFTLGGTSLMRWRVESEQPFFDNDFFDFVSRLPHRWRYGHRLYVHMLRTCFKDAAKTAWQRTGLPARAPRWLTQLSLGFQRLDRYRLFRPLLRSRQSTDFAGWMRGPLRGFVAALLNDPKTLDRGLCRPDALRRVVDDHLEARRDNSSLLGNIMALELFARLFVDRDKELIECCRVDAPPARIVDSGSVA